MASTNRSVRGDVNVILNQLIRDGVIESFETNFGDPASLAFAPHIKVVADLGVAPRTGAFDERRRELQSRIMRQLEPLAPGVIVSVRGTPGTTQPNLLVLPLLPALPANSAKLPAASSGGPLRSTHPAQGLGVGRLVPSSEVSRCHGLKRSRPSSAH